MSLRFQFSPVVLCGALFLAAFARAEEPAKPAAQRASKESGWSTATLHCDIVYSEVGDRKLQMDIAVPAGHCARPAIVMFPGNVPVPDPRQNLYRLMQFFAKRDYVVATVEYRGPAEGKFPASVDDAKNAVRFLRQHAAEYRLDPEHIGAWGMSMGGGVALMLAVTDDKFGTSKSGPHSGFSSRIEAVADRYGPADLTTLPIDPFRGMILVWTLGTADPKSPAMRDASPLFHVSKASAPVLAEHSRKDEVVPFQQSESFCAAMRKAGAAAELHEIPVTGHTAELSQHEAANHAAGDECLKSELAWFDRFLKTSNHNPKR